MKYIAKSYTDINFTNCVGEHKTNSHAELMDWMTAQVSQGYICTFASTKNPDAIAVFGPDKSTPSKEEVE